MTAIQKLYKKIELYPGMSVNRAINRIREYLDDQANPTKAANAILFGLDMPVPYIDQPSKATVYALAAIEQTLVQHEFDPVATAKMVELKFKKLEAKMPYMFKDGESTEQVVVQGRKGSKRTIATQVYVENKDKTEKEVIDLIAQALDVSAQNAYTYLYLIKKTLKV